MARLVLTLLGSFQARLDGEPATEFESDKVRALLAYLAVESDRPHRRERLAGLLWPERPERYARQNLSQALYNLRRAIADCDATPPFLLITHHTIQFNPSSDHWLDTAAFSGRLAACDEHHHPRLAACNGCMERLQQAVGLYQGDFLEGFSLGDSAAFEEWSVITRERLHRLVMAAHHRLADCHEQRGEYESALQHAWRQVELDPWQEEVHQQIMRLLALSGQRSEALAHYESCHRLLAEELGAEPGAETTALYERIRDGALEAPSSPPAFLTSAPLHPSTSAPFVARERELAKLNHFLSLVLAGRGRVVFVVGEAGSGKTALLQEFARRAQDAHANPSTGSGQALVVANGHCNAYTGIGDPYLPFRDLMAMLTGDVEDQWAAGTITREHACRLWALLPQAVEALVARGPDLIDTVVSGHALLSRARSAAPAGGNWLDRLRALLARDGPDVEDLKQDFLFEQYTNVLQDLARKQPLVLILDDIHWADISSVSLLFHLGQRTAESRILIVGAYRPEEVALGTGGQPHPLAGLVSEFKRHFGDILVDLDRAGRGNDRRFVDALLDTEPNRLGEDFRRRLAQHTGGHPLFTVETLRDMQERGELFLDEEGRWVAGPNLAWDALPLRVEGVIETRIGRLDADLQEVLSIASVEGERFTAEVVARVQGVDERGLVQQLSNELVKQHRLVREQGVRRVGEQIPRRLSTYRFRHHLFQKYLYQRLGEVERAYRHQDVGDALEGLYQDQAAEVAVQLARHFREAGIVEKEIQYLCQAGEQAAARFANAEAVTYFSRALDLLPEAAAPERYALLLARERVLGLQGAREAQQRDLTALERLAEALDDPSTAPRPFGAAQDRRNSGRGSGQAWRRAEVALRRAKYADVISDYPATIAAAQEAIRLARTGQAPHLEAAGYLLWGRALVGQGNLDAARTRFEGALTLAQTGGLRQVEADSLRNVGTTFFYQGDYSRARSYYEQALHVHREIGDRRGEGHTLYNLGAVFFYLEDFAGARAHYEHALRIRREIGDRWGEGHALNNLGNVSHSLGNYAQAEGYLEQCLRISREIGDRRCEGHAANNLGKVFCSQGDFARARDCFEQALHLFRAIGDRWGESLGLVNLGMLSQHLDHYQAAWEHNQQALCIAQDLGDRRVQGYALTNLGHALVELGRRSSETQERLVEAAAAYRQALALRRELGQHNLAVEPLAGLARVALDQGDLTQAQAHVEEILGHLEGRTPSTELALKPEAKGSGHALGGAAEPFRVYLTCYRVLKANRDARAQAILATAYHLLNERATHINDEAARRSFLENLVAHREILSEWAACQAGGATSEDKLASSYDGEGRPTK